MRRKKRKKLKGGLKIDKKLLKIVSIIYEGKKGIFFFSNVINRKNIIKEMRAIRNR